MAEEPPAPTEPPASVEPISPEPDPAVKPPRKRSRWRIVGGALFIGLPVVTGIGALMSWLFLRSELGNEVLREAAETQGNLLIQGGDLAVGDVETDLFRNLALRDVHLTTDAGQEVLGARAVELSWNVLPLLGGRVEVPVVRVEGLVLDLEQDQDGLLNLQRLFGVTERAPPSDEPWAGLPIDIEATGIVLEDAAIRYRFGSQDWGGDGLSGTLDVTGSGKRIAISNVDLKGTLRHPAEEPVTIGAQVVYTGDAVELPSVSLTVGSSQLRAEGDIGLAGEEVELAVLINASPIDVGTVDHLFNEPGLAGTYEGAVRLDGPLSDVALTGTLVGIGSASGSLTADAELNLSDGRVPWAGTLVAEQLDIVALYPGAGQDIVVTGTFRGGGEGVTWPDDLTIAGTFQPAAVTVRQYELTGGLVPLEISGGVLQLSGGVADTPYGTYSTSGTVGLVKGGIALDVTGEVVAEELARIGVSDLRGVGPVTARVTGSWKEDGMPIRARGHVSLRDFGYTDQVSFETMEADFDVRLRDGDTHAKVNATARRGVAYGLQLGQVVSPDVSAHLWRSGLIEAGGTADVTQAVQPGVLELSAGAGPWTFVSAPGAEPAATAELLLGALTVNGLPASHGRAGVDMANGLVAFDVDLDDGPRDMIDAVGVYGMADANVVLTELATELVAGARLDGVGTQRIRLTEAGFDDLHFDLRGPAGEVAIDGRIELEGSNDATFRTTNLDLAAVDRILQLDQSVGGRLDASGKLVGPAASPLLDVELSATRLSHPSLTSPIDVRGPVYVADGDVRVDLRVADGDDALLRAKGLLGVNASLAGVELGPRKPIDVMVTVAPGEWSRFEALLPPPGLTEDGEPEEATALPDGLVSATMSVDGLMGDPNVVIRGVTEIRLAELPVPARAEFWGDRRGGETDFWLAAYEGTHLAAVMNGTSWNRMEDTLGWALGDAPEPDWNDLDSFMDDLDVTVSLRDVNANTLAVLGAVGVPLDGQIAGNIRVEGRPSGPTVDVDVDWREAVVGAAALGRVKTSLERDGEGYALNIGVDDPTVQSGEPALVVNGRVPLGINLNRGATEWGTGNWDLAMSGAGLPLELLSAIDPAISEGSGRLAVTGTITGDFLDPHPDIEVGVKDGSLVYRDLNLKAKGINVKASANESLVSIKNLAFDTVPAQEGLLGRGIGVVENSIEGQGCGGRNVRVRGSLRIDDWTPTTVAMNGCLNSALVSATEDLYLKVSGTTDETGTALVISNRYPDLQVTGSMLVERAQVLQDVASFYQTAPLVVDPIVQIHRSGTVAEALEAEVVEPPFYAPFDVNLNVDLGQATQATVLMPFFAEYGQLVGDFSRVDVKARVSGKVNARMDNAALALFGEVGLEDGSVRFLTRSFELDDGAFVFTGTDYANPTISVDASTVIEGAPVALSITGTSEQPNVAFTSSEYSDPNQVFTMVLLGTRPESASSTDAASQLLSLAGSTAISTLLANEGLSSRGFTVSWDPDGAARIGVPVGRRVYGEVIYRPTNTQDVNQTAFSATVRPIPNGVIEGTWGNRNSWVEVFWETRW